MPVMTRTLNPAVVLTADSVCNNNHESPPPLLFGRFALRPLRRLGGGGAGAGFPTPSFPRPSSASASADASRSTSSHSSISAC